MIKSIARSLAIATLVAVLLVIGMIIGTPRFDSDSTGAWCVFSTHIVVCNVKVNDVYRTEYTGESRDENNFRF